MSSSGGRISIAGSGSVGGGTYTDVHVSGSGRVIDAIETDTLRVSGTLVAEAPVKAGNVRVSGAATCLKDLQADTVGVSGALTCGGSLTTEKLNVSGSVEVAERLSGGTIEITGEVKVGGDCEVERFKSRGGFTVGGLLSADTVDVKMYGRCSAGEIGGESIEVRIYRNPLQSLAAALGFGERTVLETQSVEGDRVYLERTKARTVRGRDVELGEGCEIDLVEYSGELRQAADAKVKTVRKAEDVASAPQS